MGTGSLEKNRHSDEAEARNDALAKPALMRLKVSLGHSLNPIEGNDASCSLVR